MSKNQRVLVKNLVDRRKNCKSSNVKVIPNLMADNDAVVISPKDIQETEQKINIYRCYLTKIFNK